MDAARNCWERWQHLFVGVVVAIGFIGFGREYQPPETSTQLITSILSVSAIIVGFLATAKSILISMDGSRVVRMLKEARKYDSLVQYFMSAINWSMILAGTSAVVLLVDTKESKDWHWIPFAIWCTILTIASCSAYRVIRIYTRIVVTEGSES